MSEAAARLPRGGAQVIPRPAQVRIGPGAWWSAPSAVAPAHVTVEQVRAALAAHRPAAADLAPPPAGLPDGERAEPAADTTVARSPSAPAAGSAPAPARYTHSPVELHLPGADRRPAAVLCAVWDDGGEAAVVLTRRSARLRSHTGEVAFPGGRLDAGETPLAAALREADEEVGIDPRDVEIVGRLSPLATLSSQAAVVPFVGILPRRPVLRPNPAEVDRAFSVALVDLMAPGTYHEERWEMPGFAERAIHFFELPGDTVWGATAHLLRELLDVVCPPGPATAA